MPRTDTTSRVVGTTAARVYRALVDPEALATWLPPQGIAARFERFDARPGGSYRLVLTYNDAAMDGRGKATADSDVIEARFVNLVPDDHVVQEVDFESDDPSFAGIMTMTWKLRSVTETLVEITAEDVPDGISADDHAAGMASSLANLAKYLEE